MVLLSWGFFINAWTSNEISSNAGGLVRWPVYFLIPAGFSLLFLQGLAELLKRVFFIMDKMEDPIPEDTRTASDVATDEFLGEHVRVFPQGERS